VAAAATDAYVAAVESESQVAHGSAGLTLTAAAAAAAAAAGSTGVKLESSSYQQQQQQQQWLGRETGRLLSHLMFSSKHSCGSCTTALTINGAFHARRFLVTTT
jgi:hypothetical protein